MTAGIPPRLPPAVGGLDIAKTCTSLLTIYITFLWRGWADPLNVRKRKRNVAIGVLVLAGYVENTIGIVFSSVNLLRRPQRHTLALRLILQIHVSPLLLLNFYSAYNLFWPADPHTGVKRRSLLLRLTAGLVTLGTMILAFVATVESLKRSDTKRDWAAIVMWPIPTVFYLCEIFYRKLKYSTKWSDLLLKESFFNYLTAFTIGTMISAILFIVIFALDWDERLAQITSKKEAWIQLAEAGFGVGG